MPVERRVVPPSLQRGQAQFLRRDAIGDERGNTVAVGQPALAQRMGDLIYPAEQVAGLVLGAIRLDYRDPVRIVLRTLPEPHQ